MLYIVFLDGAKAKHFYSICATFALAQAQTHFVYSTRVVWRACGIWKTVTVIIIMAAPAQPTLPIHIAQYYTLMPLETWFDIVGGSVWLCSMLLPFISYALCSLSSNHTPFGVDCCYCSCSLFFFMQKFHSIITQHRLSCASLVFSYTQTPLI